MRADQRQTGSKTAYTWGATGGKKGECSGGGTKTDLDGEWVILPIRTGKEEADEKGLFTESLAWGGREGKHKKEPKENGKTNMEEMANELGGSGNTSLARQAPQTNRCNVPLGLTGLTGEEDEGPRNDWKR